MNDQDQYKNELRTRVVLNFEFKFYFRFLKKEFENPKDGMIGPSLVNFLPRRNSHHVKMVTTYPQPGWSLPTSLSDAMLADRNSLWTTVFFGC